MIRRALVLFLIGTPARADDAPNAENVADAKVLFEEAQKLMDEKRYPEACAKFRASEHNAPKVGTLLNLADCYEKNGQIASAWATYGEAIALGRKESRPEYESFAKKKSDELEAHLVRLTIAVPAEARTPGMKIERDGARVDEAEWGAPLPVDPGMHHIVVTAPKKIQWATDAEIKDASISVSIPKLEDAAQAWPLVSQPVQQPIVEPSPWTSLRIAGIATSAVGLGGVTTGIILGVAAKSTYDGAFTKCGMSPTNCPPDAVADGKTAHTMADVATTLFIIGTVATGVGITLVVAGGPKEPKAALSLGSISGYF